MARRKLNRVLILEKSTTRLAAIKSIDQKLDLGNNINVGNYEEQVNSFRNKLAAYNTALSTLDDLYNDCITQEAVLKDWSEKILMGVAMKFGKDSSQYEMAGGVKKSDRKKPVKKPKA